MGEFQSDHDAIITLVSEVRQISNDIKDLKNSTSDKIRDHERRLRLLEETALFKKDYIEAHETLTQQVSILTRYIYIGIGGLIVLEFILNYLPHVK